MNIDEELERLSQNRILAWLQNDHKVNEMITVYLSEYKKTHNYGIYSALIPSKQIDETLSRISWDFSHGQGKPGAVIYHNGEEEHVEYFRFGNDSGIEPLIIDREFHGIRSGYKEISEEFRLFHDLYHDKKQDQFTKIDDDGNESVVVLIKDNNIKIRLKEIKQFLAIKEMHLAIQFDCREHSKLSLEELKLIEKGSEYKKPLISWGLHYGDFGGIGEHKAFSRLLGKRLIEPLPKVKSGFWGFAEETEKKYADFIINVDENGEDITYTSNPDSLANYFGANPHAPNYLTPVHFKKQVLDKYYQQPSKYSVEDSILRCGYLWSLQIDNHHDEKVCAWLGDLGRDLPYKEQLHWLTYNIPPEGGISKTYYKRQILAQSTDSDRSEHLFGQRYCELIKACEDFLGWQLLLPLVPADEYYLRCVRIPATDEQRDFDELVLGLSKILIDSLNEKELNKLIPAQERGGGKGSIAKLEYVLNLRGFTDSGDAIIFLRRLQNLRSSSSAHRKGKNYKKIAQDFEVESKNLRVVFSGILDQGVSILEYLITVVISGKLSGSQLDV